MSWFQRVLYSVDPDQDQKDLDRTDAALRALNKKELEKGNWDQETFDQAEANLKRGEIKDVQAEIDKAFDEGWEDGARNIRGTIGAAIGTPFSLIPWQLWLVLAAALFFYMGGAGFLKGKLNR